MGTIQYAVVKIMSEIDQDVRNRRAIRELLLSSVFPIYTQPLPTARLESVAAPPAMGSPLPLSTPQPQPTEDTPVADRD
jgi:hypothetical protein